MNFNKDFIERVWRTFYIAVIASAKVMLVANVTNVFENGDNGSTLGQAALAIGISALAAGVTAVKALIGKGIGANPNDGSLKGAFNGNGAAAAPAPARPAAKARAK